jgi:hypothetical protein
MKLQDQELIAARGPHESLTRRDRRALTPLGTTLDLPAGRVIQREGRECRQLVVLVRGIAAVTTDGLLDGLLHRGAVWGDAGLSGRATTRALVAAVPLRIHVYDPREFRALGLLCPDLGQRLLRTGTAAAGLDGTRPQSSPPSRCEQGVAALEYVSTGSFS